MGEIIPFPSCANVDKRPLCVLVRDGEPSPPGYYPASHWSWVSHKCSLWRDEGRIAKTWDPMSAPPLTP